MRVFLLFRMTWKFTYARIQDVWIISLFTCLYFCPMSSQEFLYTLPPYWRYSSRYRAFGILGSSEPMLAGYRPLSTPCVYLLTPQFMISLIFFLCLDTANFHDGHLTRRFCDTQNDWHIWTLRCNEINERQLKWTQRIERFNAPRRNQHSILQRIQSNRNNRQQHERPVSTKKLTNYS